MKSRVIDLTLKLVMVLTLFSACQKKEPLPPGQASSEAPAASAFPAIVSDSCAPDNTDAKCSSPAPVAAAPEAPLNPARLAEAANRVGDGLYSSLAKIPGNIIYSPFSISAALALATAGAATRTEQQFMHAFGFSATSPDFHVSFGKLLKALDRPELKIANRLWGQKDYSFLDDYLTLTRTQYGAALEKLDFAQQTEPSRKAINHWVEERTNGRIPDLLQAGSISPATRLVLTNAIYFKAAWQRNFPKSATHDEPFTTADGKDIKVPMMSQKSHFKYFETSSLQGLELPYKNSTLAALVLLPREKAGLPKLEKDFNFTQVGKWTALLSSTEVNVSLPRFKMNFAVDLEQELRSLGITDAFDATQADFSKMDGKRDLFISKAIHKAFVEVNEEGTEAAAATGMVMDITGMPMDPPVVFKADHPFLFVIRDTSTGVILFVARVNNPQN